MGRGAQHMVIGDRSAIVSELGCGIQNVGIYSVRDSRQLDTGNQNARVIGK